MLETNVTLPSKPRVVSEEEFQGVYEIDGLFPGYGHTLGNSLRRIILASLPGATVTQVKIEGVQHEFSTIEDGSNLLIRSLQARADGTPPRHDVLYALRSLGFDGRYPNIRNFIIENHRWLFEKTEDPVRDHQA